MTEILDQLLPQELVEDGDNCGLLIGDLDQDIQHIRVALEVTNDVIAKGIEEGVDLFLVHHPLLYKPLRTVTTKDGIGAKTLKLIQNSIGLYAAHSNLDRMPEGLNRQFGHKIGLSSVETTDYDHEGFILKGKLKEKMTLKSYASHLAKVLEEPYLRFMGDGDKLIERVGFCTGSGMDLLGDRLFDEVDVYLTGDIKYHYAMETIEVGNALIDINHYSSESIAADVLVAILDTPLLKDIQITKDSRNINPINYSEVTL